MLTEASFRLRRAEAFVPTWHSSLYAFGHSAEEPLCLLKAMLEDRVNINSCNCTIVREERASSWTESFVQAFDDVRAARYMIRQVRDHAVLNSSQFCQPSATQLHPTSPPWRLWRKPISKDVTFPFFTAAVIVKVANTWVGIVTLGCWCTFAPSFVLKC